MNSKFHLTRVCSQHLKRFYRDQRGVYMAITAPMGAALLGLVALSVDGSGLLLDKARFEQGVEQAALALVSESNEFRENQKHYDVTRQTVSQQDKDKFDNDEFKAQQDRRNQELLKGISQVYMRSYIKDGNPASENLEAKITKDFYYKCEQIDNAVTTKNNYSRKPIVCEVQGEMERKSWLYLADTKLSFDKREKINSGLTYAKKERGTVIPIDLMLVLDFSTSMSWSLEGIKDVSLEKRRYYILRNTVGEISDILLPKDTTKNTGVSPFNRIGFVSFSTYAQERGVAKRVFPYYGNDKRVTNIRFRSREYSFADAKWNDFEDVYKGYGLNSFNHNDCRAPDQYGRKLCTADVNIKPLIIRAMNVGDWYTVTAIFNSFVDIKETITQIDSFDGKNKNYELVFDKDNKTGYDYYLLNEEGKKRHARGTPGLTTSEKWFTQDNRNIVDVLDQTQLAGDTNISSGVIIGANYLMDQNTLDAALPKELGSNTQRIMLMLSDGEDNTPDKKFMLQLLNNGICDRIRTRIDSLQDNSLKKLPTKIAFVAFGYDPPADLAQAWKKCVGEDNFFIVKEKEALLEAFKSVIGIQEEVGSTSSKKPTFN
ncbi:pilus assembly protein [Glaesserella sp.]|uniref:TadE/TadG family type IV pilus assembly protein n=1 Tax=Glaesserella sp. TaxID=2094731 RepID=UPI0035A118C8